MEKSPGAERSTIRTHKRQFILQILVPFLILAGLIIAGAVAALTAGATRTGTLTDIAVIWLLIPAMVLGVAILAITITFIYGMAELLKLLPRYSGKAQDFFTLLSSGTHKLADGVSKPLIWFRQASAAVKSLFNRQKLP
jgi:hypothetical protein